MPWRREAFSSEEPRTKVIATTRGGAVYAGDALTLACAQRARAVEWYSVSVYEDLIKAKGERVHSEMARPLMMIRRQRGEAPFGFFKQFGGLRRFAGRGLEYASKKTLLAAAGWKDVDRDKENDPRNSSKRGHI